MVSSMLSVGAVIKEGLLTKEHLAHEQDVIKHESLDESKNAEKDSEKSVI